jgi:peptide/nickel transport system ATP-binding protein
LAVLEVRDLHVTFPTGRGTVQAVRGVSFSAHQGKTLAIVGESGSGKSTCASSILRLNPQAQVSGQVLFHEEDLLTTEARRLRATRGDRISIILQDPLSGLHPYHKVGWQIVEAIRAHRPEISRRRARDWAIEGLNRVGLPDPRRVAASYPFQLSGGMRQRAMIAMAVILDPEVLIADEPTSALDMTVQAEILELIGSLKTETGMAVILITHDLDVVSQMADDLVVMYAGSIVERASQPGLFVHPAHPYSDGLLRSSLKHRASSGPLNSIPGTPPDPLGLPDGCPFHPRCSRVTPRCRTDTPQLMPVGANATHDCSCWNPLDDPFRVADRTGV